MSSAAERPLFVPYKAIGYVTDGRPFCAHRLGSEVFLIASVGSAFQVLRADHLTVSMVSRSVDGEITALQVSRIPFYFSNSISY
jgi:U3 small nucleolar RNA-associated protein 21